jgi:hypothetical protein
LVRGFGTSEHNRSKKVSALIEIHAVPSFHGVFSEPTGIGRRARRVAAQGDQRSGERAARRAPVVRSAAPSLVVEVRIVLLLRR